MADSAARHDFLDRLGALLDRERQALIRGDFQTVEMFMAERDALIAGIVATPPSEAEALVRVQAKLRRNRRLFEEALAGLRVTRERLETGRPLQDVGGACLGESPRPDGLQRRA